jgi:hypothetical protein
MRLDSTNPRMWVPVATLLTTMAFGCDGASNDPSERESEFARREAARDAGVVDDGESTLDGSVSVADGTSTSLDGGTITVTDDQADAAVQLTDDQIYGILVAYNDAELSALEAGAGKLRDPATVTFARAVTRSANTAKSRHTLLARAEGLTPADSEQSTQRERVASDIDTMLETEEASDSLDLRYAFGEAMTNQLLVDTIDETLLPQADSELLKSELRTTRETARLRVTEGGSIVAALTPSVEPAADPAADVTDTDTVTTDAGASER